MVQLIKKVVSEYMHLSIWGKILLFVILFVLLIHILSYFLKKHRIEGFEQNDSFLFKQGPELYDDFYASIYDYLVFNNLKDDYEVGQIIQQTEANSQSRILDVGCGTGHHVATLSANHLDVLGIDNSVSMIKKAKENYPDYKFAVADALDGKQFSSDSFTHILCLYFTIYYFKDKKQFFENCYKWLMPGGYLVLHLVDRDRFDPILPPGNPLMFVSPQRYAKNRITTTKVKFNDFDYSADFQLDKSSDIAKFIEKFKDDATGKVRKQEHIMYMDDIDTITSEVLDTGFTFHSKIDLLACQYEYQYLYVFYKSN